MAKPELGTKRVCPETGRKFYDLNKDPIVSPYTGQTYPRSFFEAGADTSMDEEDEVEEKELDTEEDAPETVSLEDADDEASSSDKAEISDIDGDDDDDDVDLGDDEDDTFLDDDEDDDDDDVKDFIGVGDDDEES
ncbi:TIGR02300 family protein [Nitratireductor kimnyeongensis]|uniref:TIGR02300 family protein n=1 Tax=Nitratireductor kimnyeongensis TaxID=430679 RepID=A0ABW0TF89_9HYPH|nr:TIGR02300 family protein [Nitratireductor kimnyeongensis]QZZ37212.1 TIGR02300 family protein [Nitratireductor kimnyeongensis]